MVNVKNISNAKDFVPQQMSMEMDDERSSPLESVLEEIKALENDIALADYELRKPPSQFVFPIFLVLIELVKERVKQFKPLYARRDELVSKIPDFWLRVVRYSAKKLTAVV